MSLLIVVPVLNEADHLAATVTRLLADPAARDAVLAIPDSGSTDGSLELAARLAASDPRIRLVDNVGGRQGAGVNRAVATYGDAAEVVLRADAHCGYPADFVSRVVEAMAQRRADGVVSVVVPMDTVGITTVQRAAAAAQNSVLGNGGSAHRTAGSSGYVDHGHHAAMVVSAFREVGGYDEAMVSNEDAELDARLTAAGGRIWLAGDATITYYPRASFPALARQYRSYGLGRAQNVLKHRTRPKLRQLAPAVVTAANVAALVTALRYPKALALPVAYAGACTALGAAEALRAGDPAVALAGPAAMVQHHAWGAGFWTGLLRYGRRR